jgi:glycosyltransferase involved in cell wall biosynthesis
MKPRVALSMIVRDAEQDLRRCLESARDVVDEIVIADTGSTDRTLAIAAEYNARVIQIAWEDDFALARNQSLAAVTADWVLMLDADEELDPAAGESIASLILRSSVSGYMVTIRNYVTGLHERIWDRPAKPNESPLESAKPYPAYVEHENVRLFRHEPHITFVGRVHETVGHRITEAGGLLEKADFCIHHFGMTVGPEVRARKNRFYRDLGRRKVQERPGDAQAHFELGLMEFDNFHNYEEALRCFHRGCELNPKLTVSWLFAALTALRLGRNAPALAYIRGAQAQGYCTPMVLETEGDANYNLGNYPEAVRLYSRAHRADPASGSLQSKLAMAELRCGDPENALRRLRRALHEERHTPEIHDRLISALVFTGRLNEAAEAAEAKLESVDPDETSFMRAVSIRVQLREWEKAEASVAAGLEKFPQSERLQQALAAVQSCGLGQRDPP